MSRIIETIREDLTPSQVLAIREKEQQRGRLVNINRIHSALVEIQIIHPDAIDVTPRGRAGHDRLVMH